MPMGALERAQRRFWDWGPLGGQEKSLPRAISVILTRLRAKGGEEKRLAHRSWQKDALSLQTESNAQWAKQQSAAILARARRLPTA